MTSERVQRQIDRLLEVAEAAIAERDWALVSARCESALALNPENADARAYLQAAARATAPGKPDNLATLRLSCGSLDRARGCFALELDLLDEAEHWLELGRDFCSNVGFALDEGQCLLGLAEVAERRGDHPTAVALLDQAGELARVEAKYFLDQALARKEILKA